MGDNIYKDDEQVRKNIEEFKSGNIKSELDFGDNKSIDNIDVNKSDKRDSINKEDDNYHWEEVKDTNNGFYKKIIFNKRDFLIFLICFIIVMLIFFRYSGNEINKDETIEFLVYYLIYSFSFSLWDRYYRLSCSNFKDKYLRKQIIEFFLFIIVVIIIYGLINYFNETCMELIWIPICYSGFDNVILNFLGILLMCGLVLLVNIILLFIIHFKSKR